MTPKDILYLQDQLVCHTDDYDCYGCGGTYHCDELNADGYCPDCQPSLEFEMAHDDYDDDDDRWLPWSERMWRHVPFCLR